MPENQEIDTNLTTPLYEEIHFIDTQKSVWNYSKFNDDIVAQYQNGILLNGYEYFGSHQETVLETTGFYFAVWAPNATYISVIGDFNKWQPTTHKLYARKDSSGIWEGFIPNITPGSNYKYHIIGRNGFQSNKSDPYARFCELRPNTASLTYDFSYNWEDKDWLNNRKTHNALSAPWLVYELHLGSWMRPDKNNEEAYNSYRTTAEKLVPYLKEMGFTHVEFMPVTEFPYDGSWGYQATGYFAATSRFGKPEDLKFLIDQLHQAGIGVILDWVPSHFPADAHGLYMFDGEHTYEYADMRKGYHPDWNSYIFNYRRNEVKSFLLSSAHFWFREFHIDGIRVDAVSSLLKLDYSRNDGQWEPNEFGGNGNLEAIAFLKYLNETLYRDFEGIQTIAEESTDWPGISKPTSEGGIGFGMKWMMGWMHDTFKYFSQDPIYRKFHQDQLTFSMMYFYDENFMLPISHDEVVHGKSPMLYKMPGDEWQKFANLRLLYAYMFAHPGAKLLFMGSEFGATNEWNYQTELQWELLQYKPHEGLQLCVRSLMSICKDYPAMHELQFDPKGFDWVNLDHRELSIMVFKRTDSKGKSVIIYLNLTPVPRTDFTIELKGKARYEEIFNSDYAEFNGTGEYKNEKIKTKLVNKAEKVYKVTVKLPPLGAVFIK
ncbi:1,4-alpha-glucan branching protein GlgB [Polluticaenibacter yanchengensis]|uniref:1,4-alpha-glucan branching enzyme GlgB n=1 Tax=Polluticaenibacter yanchengensis TaxID=3014562 RepID=A0ABT4UJ29_9BACT|nr:1,4-alpha-glucan branching protein GlgB [Chitinophagaceae bacterium LY-5]